MNNGFQWWLVILGIALGAGLLWLILGRLPRQEDDVAPSERAAEAVWISRTIEDGGGIAPTALVEEILELHGAYLQGSPVLVEPATDPPATPLVRPAEDAADATDATPASLPVDPWHPDHTRPQPALSVGDGPSMQRHDPRREAPEADVRQPG